MVNMTCIAVGVIQRARKYSKAACLVAKELNYVLHHPDLHNLDKLIWGEVAASSAEDPSLTCTLEIRALARLFETNVIEIFQSLLRLKKLGFLLIGWDVQLSRFGNISSGVGVDGKSVRPLGALNMPPDFSFEEVESVHCSLVLPNGGLIAVIGKKEVG